MKYLRLAILFCVLLTCCVKAPAPRALVVHDQPKITLQLHGDTEFSLAERALVADAIAQIEYQTAGLYRIGVTYDLDFSGMPEKWTGTAWLVRAESTYPWIAAVEFQRGGAILGVTLRTDEGEPQVYLIADRLVAPGEFRHVVMHELLHAGGLDDLPGTESVMSGSTCERAKTGAITCFYPTCLSLADQAEFCRVAKCRVDELNACGS